jgi:hypothetical protein
MNALSADIEDIMWNVTKELRSLPEMLPAVEVTLG